MVRPRLFLILETALANRTSGPAPASYNLSVFARFCGAPGQPAEILAARPSQKAKTVALKTVDTRPAKPEDQELARKLEEQAALEAELADRELRSANLRAELGAFERQYLHFVGSRYAELDEWKARIAEKLVQEQPGNERAQQAARQARARASDTKTVAGERSAQEPRSFQASPQI